MTETMTLGDYLAPIPLSPLAADPAYFTTAQPWPPASAYPAEEPWPASVYPTKQPWPASVYPTTWPADESEVSSLNSDDSPPARRRKLEHRPVDHRELASWRERYRKMKLRLWNLESCRTRPKAAWETAYLKLFIDDLQQAIAKAAGTLGRRPRLRAREAP